jgi:hypothetical protein
MCKQELCLRDHNLLLCGQTDKIHFICEDTRNYIYYVQSVVRRS